jgi:hypothetical protein
MGCKLSTDYSLLQDLLSKALSVGIFPYVLKLLQSPAIELCQILVFIWAKILALDKVADTFANYSNLISHVNWI